MSKLTERFEKAVLLAIRLHSDQLRKGTDIPYASHLLAVASLVLEYGGDEDVAIAGLLHDAAEDQGGLQVLDRIREQFGDRVAEIVEACSDTFEMPKPPWQQRKEAYLKKIPNKSDAARLVSAADKLHNCRAILSDYRKVGESIWERIVNHDGNIDLIVFKAKRGTGATGRIALKLDKSHMTVRDRIETTKTDSVTQLRRVSQFD